MADVNLSSTATTMPSTIANSVSSSSVTLNLSAGHTTTFSKSAYSATTLNMSATTAITTLSSSQRGVTPHDYGVYEAYTTDETRSEYSGEMIRYYLVWIILGIGLPSNIIAIVVVSCSKRMRTTPSGVLLLCLTIADSVVLIATRLLTLTVTQGLGDKWIHIPDRSLTVLYYINYSGRCAASFIVASISINRFSVIVYPLKSDWFKHVKNALIQVGVAVSAALLINGFVLKYPPLVNQYCEHCYFVGILFVEILMADVIISIGILILSGITIRSLSKSRQMMVELQMNDKTSQRRNRQATVLLLVVAISYVVLRIQYKVVWVPVFVMEYLAGRGLGSFPTSLRNAYYVTYCLYLLNHATNLYQYCICSQEFRSEFVRLFCPTPIQRKIMRRSSASPATNSSSSSQRIKGTVVTAL